MQTRERYPHPSDTAWRQTENLRELEHSKSLIGMSTWLGPHGLLVISSLELAELPDKSGIGPQWHISISAWKQRPNPRALKCALKAFGMVGAEEDNHHPGVARHYWRPLDPAKRVECECKEDEVVVVEADGYRWTNPPEGAGPCRGCEIAPITKKPCPIHVLNQVRESNPRSMRP